MSGWRFVHLMLRYNMLKVFIKYDLTHLTGLDLMAVS